MSSIYLGYDIHAYTNQVRQVYPTLQNKLKPFDLSLFQKCYENAYQVYKSMFEDHTGLKDGFENIYQHKNTIDPEIQDLHIGQLFMNIWLYIDKMYSLKVNKSKNEFEEFHSLLMHFCETIQQISNTCIQGVSHRLFEDAIVFLLYDQENLLNNQDNLPDIIIDQDNLSTVMN